MITGAKIELHAIEPEHILAMNEWINDPALNRFLNRHIPQSVSSTKEWVDSLPADPNNHVFAVLTKKGSLIGTVGLHEIDWKNRHAKLGIVIGNAKYHGRGYGEDTVNTLLRFAFHELNLHRITLEVFAFNKRGAACYEKCGFRNEGVLRDAIYRDGKFHDSIFMGVLRKEFDKLEKEKCCGTK